MNTLEPDVIYAFILRVLERAQVDHVKVEVGHVLLTDAEPRTYSVAHADWAHDGGLVFALADEDADGGPEDAHDGWLRVSVEQVSA